MVAALFDCERPTRFCEFRQVGVRVFPQVEEPAVFGARGVSISGLLEQPCQLQDVARFVETHIFLIRSVREQPPIDLDCGGKVAASMGGARNTVAKNQVSRHHRTRDVH